MYKKFEVTLTQAKASPGPPAGQATEPVSFEHDDTEAIVERSAIMEHDGGNPRDRANLKAAQQHDWRRQPYQGSREDAEQVAACYQSIVKNWQPCEYADLPPVPPNLREWPELQMKLWLHFWNAVESSKGS